MDALPTIEISPLIINREPSPPPLDNGSESVPRLSVYSPEVKQMKSTLIREVAKRPSLYNFNHPDYKNAEVREEAWLHIAKLMNENSDVLKREWKMLRDSLRQVMTRNRKLGARPKKKWYFERQMSFLIPYMSERTSRAGWNSSRFNFNSESSDSEMQEDPSSQVLEIVDEFESEDQQQEEASQDPWAQSQTPIQNPVSFQQQPDDLELFFSSICQSAKRLPRRYQNNLKKQVLELLMKTEDEFERQSLLISHYGDCKKELE